MINVKKGTAHSLAQSDFIGLAKSGEAVKQGMLVYRNSSGEIVKAGAAASATLTDAVNASRYGFALSAQADEVSGASEGDVLESGKVGVYGLDGNSVIETDQTAATITAGNYPDGSFVIPDATATGKVRTYVANGKIIGTVDGIRTLRGTAMLGIKLAA